MTVALIEKLCIFRSAAGDKNTPGTVYTEKYMDVMVVGGPSTPPEEGYSPNMNFAFDTLGGYSPNMDFSF